MTMKISGGNQHKVERIARKLVQDLTVLDIDTTINEALGTAGEQRICSAIDKKFLKKLTRGNQLEKQFPVILEEDMGSLSELGNQADKLFDEYVSLSSEVSTARQQASFSLGYAAALRLCSPPAKGRTKRP